MKVTLFLLSFLLLSSSSYGGWLEVQAEAFIKDMVECVQKSLNEVKLDNFLLKSLNLHENISAYDLHIFNVPQWEFAIKIETLYPLKSEINLKWADIGLDSPHYLLNLFNIISGEGEIYYHATDLSIGVEINPEEGLVLRLNAATFDFKMTGLKIFGNNVTDAFTYNTMWQVAKMNTEDTPEPIEDLFELLTSKLLPVGKECLPALFP